MRIVKDSIKISSLEEMFNIVFLTDCKVTKNYLESRVNPEVIERAVTDKLLRFDIKTDCYLLTPQGIKYRSNIK
ncbi:MAG: hypothetical protein IJ356_03290 [Erysipelotrichaceae bacterium]|nr:hypothetical protein [Erysipelotrichaceae bacterium]